MIIISPALTVCATPSIRDHLYGGIERGGMLAQTLTFVEGKERDAACLAMCKLFTNDAAVGIINHIVRSKHCGFLNFLVHRDGFMRVIKCGKLSMD